MKLLFFLLFALLGLMSCENNIDKPPSSGTATVLLNQESWNSEIVIINRDASVGWDNILLAEYWPDNTVKAQLDIVLEFDLIENQKFYPFTSSIVPLPSTEIDSIITLFAHYIPGGDAITTVYRVNQSSDLSNQIKFDFEIDNPKLVTATWEVELLLDENRRASAEAEGHPDTIRMENGVATFRLP